MAEKKDRAVEDGFVRVFGAGQTIFRKGEPAAGMYVVLQGRVEATESSLGAAVLSPGDVFGEEGMAKGFRRLTTARAAEESLLLFITEDNFLRLVRLKPELVLQAVKKMGERIARWSEAEAGTEIEVESGAGSGAEEAGKVRERDEERKKADEKKGMEEGGGGSGDGVDSRPREATEVFVSGEEAVIGNFLDLAAKAGRDDSPKIPPATEDPAGADRSAKITFDKKVTCPVCRSSFQAKSFFAHKLKLVRQDSELRNHYVNFEPLLFGVWVCPDCYYAGLADFFEQVTPRQRAVLLAGSAGRRQKFGELGEEGGSARAVKAHLLVLENLEQIDADPARRARVWLRLAWLNDDAGNSEAAARARKKALEMFEKAYFTSTRALTPEQDQQMAYLIGELHARLGNPEESLRYLRRAVMQKKGNAQFTRQVQDRLYEVKNMVKERGGEEA